jgi:hypothetical protein
MFALVQQTFLAKNLVKSLLLIATLHKVIYYKGTFLQGSTKHHKIGWEKMPRFFNNSSSR